MLVVLLTAALLSLFSMYVIRGSVLKQATDDSRSDFSSQIVRVQKHLNASNLTGTDQYQQLVSNLASELQSNGSSNLVGVYLMERDAADSAERGFVPVSTEPEYSNLVSSSMRKPHACRYVRIDLLSAGTYSENFRRYARRGFGIGDFVE